MNSEASTNPMFTHRMVEDEEIHFWAPLNRQGPGYGGARAERMETTDDADNALTRDTIQLCIRLAGLRQLQAERTSPCNVCP